MNRYTYCPRCAAKLKERRESDAPSAHRQECTNSACDFVFYNTPTPVVAAIVQYESDVILVRAANWPQGMFGLVTGFLEAEEAPEEAIVREIQEELSLSATVNSLVGVYAFAPRNEVIIAYSAVATGAIALSNELVEYKRVPVEKLKPWPFATGLAVADWLNMRKKQQFHME